MLRSLLPLRVALLGLVCGAAFACFTPGCFTPPADDVLFACEPEGDDSCPADYRCEADGCCHRIGSDLAASWGGCSVSGSTSGTDSDGSDSGTDESTDTSDATDTSESGESTDTSGDTSDESTDTSDATDTSG